MSDIAVSLDDRLVDLSETDYYKDLQKKIREKAKATQQEKAKEHVLTPEGEAVTADLHVQSQAKSEHKSVTYDEFAPEDKVSLSRKQWETGADGKDEIRLSREAPLVTGVDLNNRSVGVLRFLGYKIDFSDRITEFQQAYIRSCIQSCSPKFFVSKYNQLKCGFYVRLLSLLGISSDELALLKSEALSAGREENIAMMQENIYNIELTELIHKRNRKYRSILSMFHMVHNQLRQQMGLLGSSEYWNNRRLIEERIVQTQKIYSEFKLELSSLEYQQEYRGDDASSEDSSSFNVQVLKSNHTFESVEKLAYRIQKVGRYIERIKGRLIRHARYLKKEVFKEKEQKLIDQGKRLLGLVEETCDHQV